MTRLDGVTPKEFVLRALALVVGTLVAIGCAELGIRLVKAAPQIADQGGFVSDPDLPFRPRPNARRAGRSLSNEFDYEYLTNSEGFRDVDHAAEKPSGAFRILGLGDSFTWGEGATFDETYLRRLEAALNSRGEEHPSVEVIKAGIQRYWPEPQRILLERYGPQYSPDLVLVGFTPNDVIDTHYGMGAVTVSESGLLISREASEIGSLAMWFFENSHLARLAIKQYTDLNASRRLRTASWDDVYRANGSHEDDWRAVEDEYRKMSAIADHIGARLVVVHIPQSGPWEEMHRYPAERLARWASSAKVDFIDTLDALSESELDNLYYPRDGHATPLGYEIIAEVIYEHLVQRELVP